MEEETAPVEEQAIPPEQFVALVTESDNLVPELADDVLTTIAEQIMADYEMDKDSMSNWQGQMKRGLELAQLVKDEKTYPFGDKSANVKYPLVTSAALQFNARAYPAICPADKPVLAQTWGKDPQGLKAARGERVTEYMSFQVLNEIEEWEEETDKLLTILPIVGTMVRKWWYDPVAGRARCRLVESGALVVNDKAKNLFDAPRVSEEISLYPNEIQTRIRTGQFAEFDYGNADKDKAAPEEFVEQHCRYDLDEDGYPEPYIVTVHKGCGKAVRIVADFMPTDVSYSREQQPMQTMVQTVDQFGIPMIMPQTVMQEVVTGIVDIRRGSYFVPFKFMPGMSGGFHGTGLGLLLGDISDTINTVFNMLLNAGHMASLGGGFVGTEFRIKGGSTRFVPGEWKLAQSSGNDIRSAIVPMTFPGPDATLFSLLGLLIDAGKEVSSTKDIMTGDTGTKNMTATTTLALIEQGMMVFTAAYKRIFRSMKHEYRLLAKINAQTLSKEKYSAFHDIGQELDPAKEFDVTDMDIAPVADPRSVTKMQEMAKAEFLMQMAGQGMIAPQAAAKRMLEAADIGNVEELTPPSDPMQAQMAQDQAMMNMEMMKAQLVREIVEIELTSAKIEGEKADAVKTMTDAANIAFQASMGQIQMMLNERRQAIEQAISGRTGGMAGQPGNVPPAGLGGPNAGSAQAIPAGPVLGGQPGIGGGTLGNGGLGRVA